MIRTFLISLIAYTYISGCASAEPLRIATWNIEHLRAQIGIGSVKRTDADFKALAMIAKELDADIVALEEVDGAKAAARVFDPAEYDFYFSKRHHVQLTGFAVRKGISVVAEQDFAPLGLDGSVRYGSDLTIEVKGKRLRLLAVHLKSGCFDKLLFSRGNACEKLNRQLPILEKWIDQRTLEKIPFAVLGDFNRRFDAPGDQFFPEIDDGDPAGLDLVRVTEGRRSNCLNGRYPLYIDHIVLDEQAAEMLVANSFQQVLITKAQAQTQKLSDHCPIAVDLNVDNF